MVDEALGKLHDALLVAKRRHPLFYEAFAYVSFVPRPGIGTLAVDPRYRVFYDPAKVLEWPLPELATVLAHEVCHPLLNHYKRFANIFGLTPEQAKLALKDPTGASKDVLARVERMVKHKREWNIAADCEINHMLAMHPFPQGYCWTADKLTPPMRLNLSAEHYFESLINKDSTAPEEENNDESESNTDCGSGCSGIPHICEKAEAGDPQGVDSRRCADIRQKVEKAFSHKSAGSLPGSENRYSVGDQRGVIPWETVLATSLAMAEDRVTGSDDYTYTRISRYQEAVGWSVGSPILEAMDAPYLHVHIAVDTSASMSKFAIERALAEIQKVISTMECRVTVSSIDSKAHKFVEVYSVTDLADAVQGGGGTSFIPLFSAISKRNEDPGVLVLVTDGGGQAPDSPPNYPVVWLLVGKNDTRPYGSARTAVRYGTDVRVSSYTNKS